ncbi:MAG: PQQ-dependent sugar dehydrogenase [Chloroflexota bacterium]
MKYESYPKLGYHLRRILLTIGLFMMTTLVLPDVVFGFDLPTNFSNEQVITDLDEPDSLEFSPDGRMFISERVTGKLRVAKYDRTTDQWQLNSQPFYTFDTPKNSTGQPEGHRSAGLRNIAFDPDFANNGFIYAFYMPNDDRHNRVVRIRASSRNPDVADANFGEELLLRIPFNNQISTGSHNGGALEFGNDGKLYITTGDGWEGDYPGDSVQSLTTLTGKVLRINRNGSIPTSNPFYQQTSGDYRAIYALGLRNPYTLSKHPNTGALYINEARGAKKDEIYLVQAGANYRHEGTNSGIGTNRQPWANAADAGGQLVTGGVWYPSSGGSFPAQYQGVYLTPLWGGNNEAKGKISYIHSNTNKSASIFEDNVGLTASNGLAIKPVMTQVGPDGDLYYLLTTYITHEGTVQRIRWTGQQTVETPRFSKPGSNYQQAQTITISTATTGAEIRYTIDGSQPTLSSPLYSSPIRIDTSMVLKAKAYLFGMNPSGTASESYAIQISVNLPPNVDAGADQTVFVDTNVTLNGSGTTDPDGEDDLLSGELWTQLSGPSVTIIDGTEEVAYFTPPTAGSYTFRLEVSDGVDVGSDQVTFTAVNQTSAGSCSGNILSNASFEESPALKGWAYYSRNGGRKSLTSSAYSDSKAAQVVISNSSNNIQFYQSGVSLQPNTTYRLSFAAYATNGRDLAIRLHEHDQDYTNYGLNNVNVNIGTSWESHTIDFTTRNFGSSVHDGRLMFWMAGHAQAGDTYWFDEICLINMSDDGTPTEPTPDPSDSPPTEPPSTTPPTGTFSSCSENVISNPSFEQSPAFRSWKYYSKNGGSKQVTGPGYSGSKAAKISIAKPSSNIQLYQSGIRLQPNTTYRLSFVAYATAGRDLALRLQEHDQDYTNYGIRNAVANIGPSWAVHTLDFTTRNFSAPINDGRLMFWMAGNAQTGDIYWFDDVCLTEISNAVESGGLPDSTTEDSNLDIYVISEESEGESAIVTERMIEPLIYIPVVSKLNNLP